MGAADARVGQVRCGVAQMRWKALAMSWWFWLRGKCSGKGKNKQRQKRNADSSLGFFAALGMTA